MRENIRYVETEKVEAWVNRAEGFLQYANDIGAEVANENKLVEEIETWKDRLEMREYMKRVSGFEFDIALEFANDNAVAAVTKNDAYVHAEALDNMTLAQLRYIAKHEANHHTLPMDVPMHHLEASDTEEINKLLSRELGQVIEIDSTLFVEGYTDWKTVDQMGKTFDSEYHQKEVPAVQALEAFAKKHRLPSPRKAFASGDTERFISCLRMVADFANLERTTKNLAGLITSIAA